jgi:sortase A
MTDAVDATEAAEHTEAATIANDTSDTENIHDTETVAGTDLTDASEGMLVANDGGDEKPPAPGAITGDDLLNEPLAFLASKRVIYQIVGTLLVLGGLLTIGLTVGLSAWHKQRQDSDTQAFLRRVNTPRPLSANGTTPFPSTVSGALIPNNVKTPTANAATRAAQPVATTTDGKDRAIIAPLAPAATATPAPTTSGTEPPTEVPTPTPKPKMPLPTHLTIPSIGVDSQIVEVGVSPVEVDGQELLTWDVAPYAVGHHFSSASPGEGENIVLSGHDDWQGEVFKNLYKIKQGAEVDVTAGDRVVKYRVDDILLLPEIGESLEKRLENAKFIGTTGDERVTLITCWPYGVDDHRVVVIAHPMA